MFDANINQTRYHACTLPRLNEQIFVLPPTANRFKKLVKAVRKRFLASEKNFRCRMYFKSQSSILAEKKRHINSKYWYIIHPFSEFARYFELYQFIVFSLTFLKDPLITSFFPDPRERRDEWNQFSLLIDVLYLLHVVITLFLGYPHYETENVVLEQKLILKKYFSTYFIWEFIGSMPLLLILRITIGSYNAVLINFAKYSYFCRFIRLGTTFYVLRQVTVYLNIDGAHDVICFALSVFYMIHWSACFLFAAANFEEEQRDDESWVYLTGSTFSDGGEPENFFDMYIRSFHTAMCLLYRASTGIYPLECTEEQLVAILIMIIGLWLGVYGSCVITEIFRIRKKVENTYDCIIRQVIGYAVKKKVTPILRHKLIVYCERRYHFSSIQESVILNTIPQHLQSEMYMYMCRRMVYMIPLLKRLHKNIMPKLISSLEMEVYLPNEVILNAKVDVDYMYFIAYGTVAMYNFNGLEIGHCLEGNHFGEIELILKLNSKTTFVAVEISEIFRLHKDQLNNLLKFDSQFQTDISYTAKDSLRKLRRLSKKARNRAEDVLQKIRDGMILQSNIKRKHDSEERILL